MSDDRYENTFGDYVVIDGYILKDICWLLSAVEAFARFGYIGTVQELLRFADDRLSADGLANIAGEFADRARRRIEAGS